MAEHSPPDVQQRSGRKKGGKSGKIADFRYKRPSRRKNSRPEKGNGAARAKQPTSHKKQPFARRQAYAAIDLGTNNCRLLIARPSGENFTVIDAFSRVVRLGEGLAQSGKLSEESMERTLAALTVCAEKLKRRNVRLARSVATEACRRASNGADFIAKVKRETGIALDIISAQEEARLAVLGCHILLETGEGPAVIFDIGGGSTELVWIDLTGVPPQARPKSIMRMHNGFQNADSRFPAAKVVDWISVPLGVATLRDQFNDVEDDSARFALMSWFFEENLAEFAPYKDEPPREGFQIVGTSGTVTTVAASHLGLKRYDRNKVDGLRMTSDEIDKVIRNYLALGPAGRRRDPRIGMDRQALIMSGAAILQALLRCWPTDRLSVADRGLREGMLYAQMSEDGVLKDEAE